MNDETFDLLVTQPDMDVRQTLRRLDGLSGEWVTVLGPGCEAGPGWEERMHELTQSQGDVGCVCGAVRAFRGARSIGRWYDAGATGYSWFGSARSRLVDLTLNPGVGECEFADGRGFVVRAALLRAGLEAAPHCSVVGAGFVAAAAAQSRGMACITDTSVYVVENGPDIPEVGTGMRVKRAEEVGYDVMAAHIIRRGVRGPVRAVLFLVVGQNISPGLLLLPLFAHKRSRFEVWRAATRGRVRAMREVAGLHRGWRE